MIGGMAGLSKRLKYTNKAQAGGIEGRIYIQANIDENGGVSCAVISTGLPAGLNESALEAVAATRFKPAEYEGMPIAMRIAFPVTFRFRR